MDLSTRFEAPWSFSLKVITVFSVLLFLVPPIVICYATIEETAISLMSAGYLAATLLFLYWIVRTQLIVEYAIISRSLLIKHLGKDIVISLNGLLSVEADPMAMRGTYVMTNGGLFVFSGKKFKNKRLGTYEAYATDKTKSVVLRFKDRVLVVTPSNSVGFVKRVQKEIDV